MNFMMIVGVVLSLGASGPGADAEPTPISLHTEFATDFVGGRSHRLSESESRALINRLVHDAQACIVDKVSDDPDFRTAAQGGRVGELIVAAFRPCWPVVDALITAHDRQYGSGSGESFITGPFLDRIPRVLEEQLR